jgi:D-alanine transfer protein
MKVPHIAPALAAVAIAAGALAGGYLYARSVEARYLHALAPVIASSQFPVKFQGSAWQRAAFREADLLPLYGSSELEIKDPYHAANLFKEYPTGFTIFPVGKMGAGSLAILQELAAVGSDLQGKKVAISITPPPYFRGMNPNENYQGNFSPLYASALAFSMDLGIPLKQKIARRMLDYPKTLERQSLTRFALHRLAENSPLGSAIYCGLMPLGQVQNVVFQLQDHWNTLAFIHSMEPDLLHDVRHEPAILDWQVLAGEAELFYRDAAYNNPFGIAKHVWERDGIRLGRQANAYPDGIFPLVKAICEMAQTISLGKEWTDLELLLQTLQELGARSLILSSPMKGAYYAYWAVPYEERRLYYDRLEKLTGEYNVPTIDFADHDGDAFFTLDAASHISSKGWIYYCKALDAFYHAKAINGAYALVSDLPEGPGPAPDGPREKIPRYEGFHDMNGPSTIAGWAWDATHPDRPVPVDIYDGEQLVATIAADRFSEGLKKAGIGNGRHVFAYAIPERLKDGRSHMIRVRIAGTSLDLKRTPKPLRVASGVRGQEPVVREERKTHRDELPP